MADGTIEIDLAINKKHFKSDSEEVKSILRKLGGNAGDSMDKSFNKNADKVKETASSAERDVKSKLDKTVKTRLEANDAGIKSKTQEAKKNVDEIPKSKKTELSAQDNASHTMNKVSDEADKTGKHFHRLRDIIHGTFIGSLASNAVSSAFSAISSRFTGIIQEGMHLNAVTAGIERRFRGMGMDSHWTQAYMTQIGYLKSRINATGADIADLQTNTANWSRIGRKGALQMTQAFGEMGDRTEMTSRGYQRLSMSLMHVGSNGKVSLGTLSKIARVAPGLYRQLAEGAGVSENHMKSMLATGKVTTAQFQKWLADSSAKGKKAFDDYAHTQTGATIRMRAAWQKLEATMTKPLFNMKTSGLNQLADFMEDGSVKAGAKMLGDAVKQIAVFGLQILQAIGRHKEDVSAIASDLVTIIGAIAKDVWEDFAGIIGDIGSDFGLVHKNGKKSASTLHTVRQFMDGIAKNKGAIKFIADWLAIIATIHGIKKVVGPLLSLAHLKIGKGTVLDQLKNKDNWTGLSKGLKTGAKVKMAVAVAFEGAQIANSLNKAVHDKNVLNKTTDSGRAIGRGLGTGIGLLFGGAYGAALGGEIGDKLGAFAGDAFKKAWSTPKGRKRTKAYGTDTQSGYSPDSAKDMAKAMRQASKGLQSWWKNTKYWWTHLKWPKLKLPKINWKAWLETPKGWHPMKSIQNKFKGFNKWAGKLGRDSARNMRSGWRDTKKWASDRYKDLKNGWAGFKQWSGELGKDTSKKLKDGWKGMQSWASQRNKDVQSGWKGIKSWFSSLSKNTVNAFKSGWRGITNWFKGIVNSIKGLWHSISGIFGNVKKFMTGKLKVGNIHLAGGTDWRRHYPVPAIVNDGNDSPRTNNREGLIDTDGTLSPFPNVRNLKWLLMPGQEVVNARDMAMFGGFHHFAKGTKSFGGGIAGMGRGGSSIRSLTRELKDLARVLKQVRKLSRISLKAKGLAKTLKDVSRLNKTLKLIYKDSRRSNNQFKALSNQLIKLARQVKSSYNVIRKHNFGKLLARQAQAAVKGLEDKGNFAESFKKLTKSFLSSAEKLNSSFTKEWSDTWEHADKSFKSWTSSTEKIQSGFNRKFESGWKSLDKGVSDIFSKFWSSMRRLAGQGMNRVISVLNSGISKINGVIHSFGGSTRAVSYAGHVRYASGTGVFNNARRPITSPTLAMVNDGNDSPETGNREALWRPSTGYLGVFEGRNTPALLMPGDEILNASETKALGLAHYATGTGGLRALYDLTKKYYKNPSGTLDNMLTTDVGMRGGIHDIARGMAKSAQDQAQDWWSTLWTMVHRKIEDGGDARGLLKAVEKYGNGHRYVFGAAGPSTFDCSGLVMYALKKAYGISYPHFSGSQYSMTSHIPKSEAHMGDLVFWGSGGSEHVGVYAGHNRYYSAQSPAQGIHMNTLSSVVGKGRPLFGRVRGINAKGSKSDSVKVKASTALEKLIRGQVGKGFWKTIQKIADKYGSGGSYANPAGDGVNRWKGLIRKAAAASHVSLTATDMNHILRVIAGESGGNPHAVNHWDINAINGHPSKGLIQFIDSTFDKYARRGHHNIYNGYDQLLAMFNDSSWRSDLTSGGWGPVGSRRFANGGFITEPTEATLAEGNGPEVVVPYGDPAKRQRALALMQATIEQMKAQDGQSAEMNANKQIQVDLTETNASINEMNAKFDKALQSLGFIESKKQDVYINNNIDPNKVGRAVYPVIKRMDSVSIRKAGYNFSGSQY